MQDVQPFVHCVGTGGLKLDKSQNRAITILTNAPKVKVEETWDYALDGSIGFM
jgi:hypothetical protein